MKPDPSQAFPTGCSNQSAGKRKLRFFSVGQAVLVKNYMRGEKWLNGVITDVLGTVGTYMVSINRACVKRHVNQMLDAKSERGERTVINTDGDSDYHADSGEDRRDIEIVTGNTGETPEETPEENQSSERLDNALEESSSSGCRECPKRNVRPPQRLDL